MASVIMHGVLVKENRLSNSSGETSFADMRSIVPAFDFKFVGLDRDEGMILNLLS